MFRIDQLRKDNLDTIINIGDVTKIVAEEVREHLEAGIYTRSITIFTENGDMKRTPSSRQKRAIIKIDCYMYEPKYTDAGV